MLSLIYYICLIVMLIVVFFISAAALILCYPFDKGRRVVHELSRMMTFVYYFVPPFWKIKRIGLENVDRKKRYVILLNHQAMNDIPTLYLIPLNFRWVTKKEVFFIPFFGQYMYLHGDIPINRGRAIEAMRTVIKKGCSWIDRGVSVAIFPEGTRSKDGEIGRFKSGAFQLARQSGADILPVVVDGTTTLIKKNNMFNWRNTITLKVLPSIPAETIAATDPHIMMEQVRGQMVDALNEIREK